MPVVTKRVNRGLLTKQKKKAARLNEDKGFAGFNELQNITYDDGESLWQVAKDNEFGHVTTDGVYVPDRPFMRTAFNENRDEYAKMMRDIAKQFLEGEKGARLSLNKALNVMKADIQEAILNWSEPPNAPFTIRKKGFNDPLVDTKTMFNNVTTGTVKKGG